MPRKKPIRKTDIKRPGTSRYLTGKRAEKTPRWKGGILEYGGYRYVYMPNHPNATRGNKTYILEHRLVMSIYLGRMLKSDEIIHHINGDGLDNRLENLELVTRAKHNKIHKFLKGHK
jgi:hypothetical protein